MIAAAQCSCFSEKRHDAIKVIFSGGSGLCLLYAGNVRVPELRVGEGTTVDIDEAALDDLFDGIDVNATRSCATATAVSCVEPVVNSNSRMLSRSCRQTACGALIAEADRSTTIRSQPKTLTSVLVVGPSARQPGVRAARLHCRRTLRWSVCAWSDSGRRCRQRRARDGLATDEMGIRRNSADEASRPVVPGRSRSSAHVHGCRSYRQTVLANRA